MNLLFLPSASLMDQPLSPQYRIIVGGMLLLGMLIVLRLGIQEYKEEQERVRLREKQLLKNRQPRLRHPRK